VAYDIFHKLETGELVWLASFDDLSEANKLRESLREHWPADNVVKDSVLGTEIDPEP
jgi:hypothetical protein